MKKTDLKNLNNFNKYIRIYEHRFNYKFVSENG